MTGTALIIWLPKRLDSGSAQDTESELKNLMTLSYESLIFHCSEMEYISSAGIRVILTATKTCMKARKKVAFCMVRPNVRQIFEIGGFTRIFTIYGTLDDTLKILNPG